MRITLSKATDDKRQVMVQGRKRSGLPPVLYRGVAREDLRGVVDQAITDVRAAQAFAWIESPL